MIFGQLFSQLMVIFIYTACQAFASFLSSCRQIRFLRKTIKMKLNRIGKQKNKSMITEIMLLWKWQGGSKNLSQKLNAPETFPFSSHVLPSDGSQYNFNVYVLVKIIVHNWIHFNGFTRKLFSIQNTEFYYIYF